MHNILVYEFVSMYAYKLNNNNNNNPIEENLLKTNLRNKEFYFSFIILQKCYEENILWKIKNVILV